MSRTVHVVVTEEDIRTGLRRVPESCALALAIKRATGQEAVVGIYSCVVGEWVDVPLPPVAIAFRQEFDDIEAVKPFEFDLVVEGGHDEK